MSERIRYGSLFSGVGGLDLAVKDVFGATAAWHCEVNPAAAKVLARHWPGVPNLGDITAVDWAEVEPVDVLCGGFPCQDVSAAGFWCAECVVLTPPRDGWHGGGPTPINYGFGNAVADDHGEVLVVEPHHHFRCQCDCHQHPQLDLFGDGKR